MVGESKTCSTLNYFLTVLTEHCEDPRREVSVPGKFLLAQLGLVCGPRGVRSVNSPLALLGKQRKILKVVLGVRDGGSSIMGMKRLQIGIWHINSINYRL